MNCNNGPFLIPPVHIGKTGSVLNVKLDIDDSRWLQWKQVWLFILWKKRNLPPDHKESDKAPQLPNQGDDSPTAKDSQNDDNQSNENPKHD